MLPQPSEMNNRACAHLIWHQQFQNVPLVAVHTTPSGRVFKYRKILFSVSGRPKNGDKKDSFSYWSGLVWTGSKMTLGKFARCCQRTTNINVPWSHQGKIIFAFKYSIYLLSHHESWTNSSHTIAQNLVWGLTQSQIKQRDWKVVCTIFWPSCCT